MDTPGLGDTEGIEKDDANVENILQTISQTPELNSIIFMMNGSDARFTIRVDYVVQKMKGFLPNVLKDNLLLLLSNVSTQPNLDFQCLGFENLPKERVFYIDNSIFSADLQNISKQELESHNRNYQKTKDQLKLMLDCASNMRVARTKTF